MMSDFTKCYDNTKGANEEFIKRTKENQIKEDADRAEFLKFRASQEEEVKEEEAEVKEEEKVEEEEVKEEEVKEEEKVDEEETDEKKRKVAGAAMAYGVDDKKKDDKKKKE